VTEDCAYVGGGILNLFKDTSLFYLIVGTVMCMLPQVALFTEYYVTYCTVVAEEYFL